MQNKYYIPLSIIIIAVLSFFNLSLLYKLKSENDKSEILQKENLITMLDSEKSNNNFFQSIEFEGIKLSDFSIQDTCNIFKIDQLIGEKPKLVFLFSENNCEKCYDFEYVNILNCKLKKEDIIIIGAFRNKRTYISHLTAYKNYSIKTYFLRMQEEKFSIPLDVNEPIYFMLDSNLITYSVFYPDRYSQNKTKRYFELVQKRVF